jgi:transcriptional regulator with XRE-family HTH domain
LHDPSEIRSAFATAITTRRLLRRWSQVDLAARSGLESSYISRLESAERTPSLDVILRIASAFEIHPETLVKDVRLRLRSDGGS